MTTANLAILDSFRNISFVTEYKIDNHKLTKADNHPLMLYSTDKNYFRLYETDLNVERRFNTKSFCTMRQ